MILRTVGVVLGLGLLLTGCAAGPPTADPAVGVPSTAAHAPARPSALESSVAAPPAVTKTTAAGRAPVECAAPVDPAAGTDKSSRIARARTAPSQEPADDTRILANQEKEELRLLSLHADLSQLCANEIAATWAAPAKDVAAAIAGAQSVVFGRLIAVTAPGGRVTATLLVLRADQAVATGQTMMVHLNYGVGLAASQKSLVVAPQPGSPVLGVGDQAILLLDRDGSAWNPVAGGELPVDGGRIDSSARAFQGSMATRVSPFGPEVDGMTPAEFFARFIG